MAEHVQKYKDGDLRVWHFQGTSRVTGKQLVIKGMQRYWRLTRALTLGAQGCVLDATGRILLIRHTYRPGWHFPGGGIELGETAETSLARELEEEAGILLDDRPELFGIYDNRRLFHGDHVVLYVVKQWRQPVVPPPNREIAEQRFYSVEALPSDINPATALRISEIVDGRAPAKLW